MTITLYGPLTSTVLMVMLILKEKDLDYEHVQLDFFKGQHKSPEYIEKNPFGQVPCLDDNGFIIYECRAICQYLAMKYANRGTPNLMPPANDIEAMSRFYQAVSIETHCFHKQANVIIRERVLKPFFFRAEPVEETIAQALHEIDAKMVGYDKILSKQRYLAGDILTLADLFHVSFGTLLMRCGWDSYKKYANVQRWWEEISSRPTWLEVLESSRWKHTYDSVI